MNPILKRKQNVQEKLYSIVEDKCCVLQCIVDMISKAETEVESLLGENDRMKFLTAYRHVNRYLESCSEKLLEIHIILSDKEESGSEDNSVSLKTHSSSVCIEDIRNECSTIPAMQLEIPEAVQSIPQIHPVPSISEPNTELSSFTKLTNLFESTPSSVTDQSLIELCSHEKLLETLPIPHSAAKTSANGVNGAKSVAQASNHFSPVSSYHSFSSLSSSPLASNKDELQPVDLYCHVSRSKPVAKAAVLNNSIDSNSLLNTSSSITDITSLNYSQNLSDKNLKSLTSRHETNDNLIVNIICNRTDTLHPNCQQSLSSDENSELVASKHEIDSDLAFDGKPSKDISELKYLQNLSLDENYKPIVSKHEIDSNTNCNTTCRRDMPPQKCLQSSSSEEDSKSVISGCKMNGNSFTSCSRIDAFSSKCSSSLGSDENCRNHSALPDFDRKGDEFQLCVKRNSSKSTSTSGLHITKCIIPPYQIEIAVNMTFVESPLNFWLQPNKQLYEELLGQLQSTVPNDSPASLIRRQHYLAPYGSDEGWHRVKLLEEPSQDGFAAVYYIDYGNTESIPTASLKLLTSSLSDFPALALHCQLKGVTQEERATSSFVKLLEEPSNSYSLFAIFSPTLSEVYPVELIMKSVTSPYSLNVAQHINSNLKKSQADAIEANTKKETHQKEESVAECDDDDYYLFADAINQEVTFEERSASTGGIQKEISICKSDVSEVLNGWPKRKSNCNSSSEYASSNSHSSSVTSWKNENDTLFDDVDVEVPVPEIVLLRNNSVPVMASVIVNPKEFYVHVASEKTCQLDDLAEQLNNYYAKSYKRTSVKSLQVGSYCACQYNADHCWYRAVVLEISGSSKSKKLPTNDAVEVIIQYIDYGNKEHVSSKDLHPLPLFLAQLPAFAVKCALSHLEPPSQENDTSEKAWPKKTVERFRELTGFEKCITAQFVSSSNSGCVQEVILWNSEETSVNDILIQEGLAIKDFGTEECEKLNHDYGSIDGLTKDWNPMADDYLNEQNLYEIDLDDPEIAFTGYKAKDEQYVCKFFSRGERCHRGERCPYKHIRNEGELTLEKEEVFSYDLSIDLPKVGTCVLAQVSAVFNPTHFYMIFPYGTVPVDDTTILAYSERENLDKFVKSMSFYYNTAKVKKPTTVQALGKIVAAKSKFDDQWYRARIKDINSVEKLMKVFYVDFGNCEWVPHYDVEEIDIKFMDFPFQAAECRLANVQIKKTEDSEQKRLSLELFHELTENNIILAQIVGHDESVLLVRLHNVTSTSDTSVNDELIVRGLAIPEE